MWCPYTISNMKTTTEQSYSQGQPALHNKILSSKNRTKKHGKWLNSQSTCHTSMMIWVCMPITHVKAWHNSIPVILSLEKCRQEVWWLARLAASVDSRLILGEQLRKTTYYIPSILKTLCWPSIERWDGEVKKGTVKRNQH